MIESHLIWFDYRKIWFGRLIGSDLSLSLCDLWFEQIRTLWSESNAVFYDLCWQVYAHQQTKTVCEKSRNKFIWLVYNTLYWGFDLITRSSSEEAGTQFFRVLMRRSAVASSQSYNRLLKDYGHRQRTRPSARKVIGLWIETRAVISWVTPTTALMRQLIVTSRKTRKNWVPASSDENLVMRLKRQNKVLKFWLWCMNFLLRIVCWKLA